MIRLLRDIVAILMFIASGIFIVITVVAVNAGCALIAAFFFLLTIAAFAFARLVGG